MDEIVFFPPKALASLRPITIFSPLETEKELHVTYHVVITQLRRYIYTGGILRAPCTT